MNKLDFIAKKIKRKIDIINIDGFDAESLVLQQSALEYRLMLILGILWNRNIGVVDEGTRSFIHKEILRPSIGTIIDICRRLDIDGCVFKGRAKKNFAKIRDYPKIRNEKLGHGYSFGDDSHDLFREMADINAAIDSGLSEILGGVFDIVQVRSRSEANYKGVRFSHEGEYFPWTCPVNKVSLDVGAIYLAASMYEKVSPFVHINGEEEYYIYSCVDDVLLGKAKYNRLISTSRRLFDACEIIGDSTDIDEKRKRFPNGTVVNVFDYNYRNYIDTGVVGRVVDFLKNNRSTVFATLWGHGGVGKTACIQRVCDFFLNEQVKYFDYIVFVSAKDRRFNYYTGKIETISQSVSSYDDVIKFINGVVFNSDSVMPDAIISFDGKMLIVLDDYETFGDEDKKRISEFIRALNIEKHRVIVTTRSVSHITGQEIQVTELSADESVRFFDSVLKCELEIDPSIYRSDVSDDEFQMSLLRETKGRPLFIFQSAVIYGETGRLDHIIGSGGEPGDEAVDFLYGRVFQYLSSDAKKLFCAIGVLVDKADLKNLLSKLKYIANMEKDEDRFDSAISELVKLKIIELIDSKYFLVYSGEVIPLMREAIKFEVDAGDIYSRLKRVGADKKMDSDEALLSDAESSRATSSYADVTVKYRHIISRDATPRNVRVRAVIGLAQYLIEDHASYDDGIQVLRDYCHDYSDSIEFVRVYARFLWAGDEDNKAAAINVLKEYLARRGDERGQYEFISLLMSYETQYLIRQREELKLQFSEDEISKAYYDEEFARQRDEFFRILKFPGKEILSVVESNKLKDFEHGEKIACVFALSSYIDVCMRIQRFGSVDAIFEYVFNQLPHSYHGPLKKKLEKLNKYREPRHYEYYISRRAPVSTAVVGESLLAKRLRGTLGL